MDGPGDLGAYLAVLFRGPVADVVGERRHGLYMVERPGPPWVFLPTDRVDRWVFSLTWDPTRETRADYPHERLVRLIRAGAGAPDLEPEIVSGPATSPSPRRSPSGTGSVARSWSATPRTA